jgi:hypothetical protein
VTHNERVLELLSDGEPHGHMEGYRLGVMLHSRVSDLRKQGHVIECWREGDSYFYRLSLQEPAARTEGQGLTGGGSWSERTDGEVGSLLPDAGPVTSPEEIGPASPYQLSIEEAA